MVPVLVRDSEIPKDYIHQFEIKEKMPIKWTQSCYIGMFLTTSRDQLKYTPLCLIVKYLQGIFQNHNTKETAVFKNLQHSFL